MAKKKTPPPVEPVEPPKDETLPLITEYVTTAVSSSIDEAVDFVEGVRDDSLACDLGGGYGKFSLFSFSHFLYITSCFIFIYTLD